MDEPSRRNHERNRIMCYAVSMLLSQAVEIQRTILEHSVVWSPSWRSQQHPVSVCRSAKHLVEWRGRTSSTVGSHSAQYLLQSTTTSKTGERSLGLAWRKVKGQIFNSFYRIPVHELWNFELLPGIVVAMCIDIYGDSAKGIMWILTGGFKRYIFILALTIHA